MALTETVEVDKVEVVGPYKTVQVRVATVIYKDGEEISRGFHRHVISAGDLCGCSHARSYCCKASQ